MNSKIASNGIADTAIPVSYFTTKTFDQSLSKAFLAGGEHQKKAVKVKAILGSLKEENPFISTKTTNHGESRIENIVKYDLGNAWRLVTQQTEKMCLFLFVGNHDSTEKWLDGQKGMRTAVKDMRPVLVPGSGSQIIIEPYASHADHHDTPLVDRLDSAAMDHVLENLPRSVARKLEAFNARSNMKQISEVIKEIPSVEQREVVETVFALLLAGNYDGAQSRVDLSMGRITSLADIDEHEILEVTDGEDIRRLRIGSSEYEDWLNSFEKRSAWHEWLLYLHPEQEKIVKANYNGVSQLSGVSGSGKTCVAVRRAMRLAQETENNVLLLTLNRSLAGLLSQLIDLSCTNDQTRARIKVTSFFELAQDILKEHEPENEKQYADVSWKLGEHVDLVFREYYRQWLNNSAAEVLLSSHKSMSARGVSGESYLREEFDWIRSALSPRDRQKYLNIDRKGRKFPILMERREEILKGLEGWERKMQDVGVIDYLGLTSALNKHIPNIAACYKHILVDEAQDFGTTELLIVRALARRGPNDIFMCGDIAQTILPKHRSVADAGLTGISRERIQKNYRNSREILKAAYQVLSNNLNEEMFDSEDLEILDPKYANFSGDVPMALLANNLEEEIAYARKYADTVLRNSARTVCITFAGYSTRDIREFANKCGVSSLDGTYDPKRDSVVFCDLEQTKGYEFDTLIILNCREGVLPPFDAPKEEAYRASCKLYVAMTRAKKELILSFHGRASSWIEAVSTTIGTSSWADVEVLDEHMMAGIPDLLPEVEAEDQDIDASSLTGVQFVYTIRSLGMSVDAQEKLIELVDGRGSRAVGGRRLKWPTVASLGADLLDSRRHDLRLGPVVAAELRRLLPLPPRT